MGRKSPRRGWDEGATAVEAAIVFSILLTLFLGIVQFGTAFWQWNTTLLAVEQVGRWAMVNNATVTAATAQTQMQNALPSASVCTVSGTTINPPAPASFFPGGLCVYASKTPGTSPDPDTISLTAIYAYTVLGVSGTLTVGSQGTFPLD